MRGFSRSIVSIVALVAQLGCADTEGGDARGVPERATQHVDAAPPEALVPVFVLYNDADPNRIYLVDLEVEGNFPDAFSLARVPPMPAQFARFPSVGAVGAAPRGHPDVVEVPEELRTVRCDSQEHPMYDEVEGAWFFHDLTPIGTRCELRWELRLFGRSYYELFRVVNPEPGRVNWELMERGGDRALIKHPGWKFVRGIDEGGRVLPTAQDIPADRYWTFGLSLAPGRTLAAGFHWLVPAPISPEVRAAGQACKDRYEQRAVERYNREHGTTYPSYAEAAARLDVYARGELGRALGLERASNSCTKLGARLVEPLSSVQFRVRLGAVANATVLTRQYERTPW